MKRVNDQKWKGEFGDCYIIEKKTVQPSQKPLLAIKYQEVLHSEDDYDIKTAYLESWRLGKTNRLAKLLDLQYTKEKKFCSEYYSIDCSFEFSQHTLQEELDYRIKLGLSFSEAEMFNIFQCGLEAIAALHNAELYHGCIRPSYLIFLHGENQLEIKLLPNMRGIADPFIRAQRLVQGDKRQLFVSKEIHHVLHMSRGPRGDGVYPKGDVEALMAIMEVLPFSSFNNSSWLKLAQKEIAKSTDNDWNLSSRILKSLTQPKYEYSQEKNMDFVQRIDLGSKKKDSKYMDYTPPKRNLQIFSTNNTESDYYFERNTIEQEDPFRRPVAVDLNRTEFSYAHSSSKSPPFSLGYTDKIVDVMPPNFQSRSHVSGNISYQESAEKDYWAANKRPVRIEHHQGLFSIDLTKEPENNKDDL